MYLVLPHCVKSLPALTVHNECSFACSIRSKCVSRSASRDPGCDVYCSTWLT